MNTENSKTELSNYAREAITEWIKRYPPERQRSGVFEALRIVQEENGGHLTTGLMDAVADFLGMPAIAVYEVATFYTMYHDHPVGKHVIEVCTNVSCALNGVEKTCDRLRERLGIKFGETTEDMRFTLKEVECLGACINAPVGMIGKKYIENLTPEKVDELLATLT